MPIRMFPGNKTAPGLRVKLRRDKTGHMRQECSKVPAS